MKERVRTFLLKIAEDRSPSTEDRMGAAVALYNSNACYGKEKEEVQKIIISLVKEFSTLPLDSFCSFYIPHNIFPEIEDEKADFRKSLLTIIENKNLSISPVVYVRFLTLFSSPGAFPDQQMREGFLLKSFLEEADGALFLERSRIVAARALSQAGDASQKTYGLSILISIFEDENVLIECRCEALEAFMSVGTFNQKERGGTYLLSFLENSDIPKGQRISIARMIKELGTEEQIKRMMIILSNFLQSSPDIA